jgi:TPP-dependent indolepyruvate ferredoxin oxidoreductase alpha subunit
MKNKLVKSNSAAFKTPSLNDQDYKIQFVQEGFDLLEGDQLIRAAVGFVCCGPSQSAVDEALSMFSKMKFPAAGFYLNSLLPFPARALEAFAEKVEKIVVIESDVTPLLSKMVEKMTWIRPITMTPPHGGSITAQDLVGKEDWV